ncbi:MAG: LON peptidase substrate-binding domain-containing protein [Planctomycetes bacterium]|nr:LON peptidase substrate-binding domain-containing protein [Planctomycetota bacterium]
MALEAGEVIRVGLFPLPGTVLFPGVPLPLHVFEPRYRALARDALAGDRRIGIVLLAPGWEADYEGRPAVVPVGGLAVISGSRLHPDGRYDLLLVGSRRFRILEEEPGGEYRRARVRILPERAPSPDDPAAAALGGSLVEAAELLRPGGIRESGAVGPDLGPLVGVAAAVCGLPPEERQELLALDDVEARARRLLDVLGPRAARTRSLDRMLSRRPDPGAN